MSDFAAENQIHVVVAMDFSDDLLQELRKLSPRLRVERHFPRVPDRVWETAEVLYTMSTLPDPAQAPRLRWIQLHHAGIDAHIQHPALQSESIEVTTASGVHAVQMAEYCLGMMLAFKLRLPLLLSLQARAEWPKDRHALFAPHDLRGQTLGIIGYGSIGRELARLADCLGMVVLAIKRDVMHPADEDGYHLPGTGDPLGELPERIYPPEAAVSMARQCDFLVVTAPLTDASRRIVSGDVLSAMKSNAVLINVGRGGLVDEAALVAALTARKIAGAALDVFEEEPLSTSSPLWALDNVILSPHISGNSADYHRKATELFAENLRRYLEKTPLLNRVRRGHGY